MKIIQLYTKDLKEVIDLLLESGLPVDDIQQAPILFFGIRNAQKLLAVAALEIYYPHAIVRSVAVEKNQQNKGIGSKLIDYLEEKAISLKIEELYLLTTTADDFFRKKGYSDNQKLACPEKIHQSEEFKNLCPDSAISLSKKL